MNVLALQSEHITLWWVALGMGLVIVVAVIVLLSLLVSFVDDIDVNLKDTWGTATAVAQNTSTTWMLRQAGTRSEELLAEVLRHDALLDTLLGAPRSRRAADSRSGNGPRSLARRGRSQ